MNNQIDIPESEMGMSGYSKFSWKLWEAGLCNMSEAQRADQIMRELGYRKASDVAREIFAEIYAAYDDCIVIDSKNIGHLKVAKFFEYLANIKKKYESEGADDV